MSASMESNGINRSSVVGFECGLRQRLSALRVDTFLKGQVLVYLIIGVSSAVTLTHLPSLSAQALFHDDADYVIENPLVQNPSWSAAGRFFREVWRPSTVRGYYQPLTMVSLMLDRVLSGPHESLRAYHCTSLALHVANTALVAILLYLLFGEAVVAAGVALLFGLHPITVESVCWIAERKTVLASFFTLWSLIAYVRFTREPKARFYVACVLTYLLALLSKPITVPLPLMMLLLDYWPLNRLRRQGVTEKLPLFAIAVVFGGITYVSQSRTARVYLPGDYNPLQIPLILGHNIVFYLAKVVYPANLSAHYGYAAPRATLIGLVAASLLIPLLIMSLKRTRALMTGWLVFFVMILPAMGIISVTPVTAANRYLYLPSIGFILITAWCLAAVLGQHGSRRRVWMPSAVVAGFLLVASAEAAAARAYMNRWHDSTSLYEYMLTLTPDSGILHRDLGAALSKAGRSEEAVEHYRQALRTRPHDPLIHFNLATDLAKSEDKIEEAIEHYEKAVEIDPAHLKAHLNLGSMFLSKGQVEEAVVHCEEAVQLNPQFVLAQYNLGKVLAIAGRPVDAIQHLREAIRLNPGFALATKDLAWFLATHPSAEVRDANEAIRLAERAREATQGQDVGVLDALAAAYALDGQYKKAVETAQKALAMATRLRSHELADRIQERLRLYQLECPYYEDPKVQLERLVAKRKKLAVASCQLTVDSNSERETENRELPTEN